MLYLIALILINAFLLALFKKNLDKRIAAMPGFAGNERREYEKLLRENDKFKAGNRKLQNSLDGIIALYDLTKEISRYLEVDKVFSHFKEDLNKYISVKDCKLIKAGPVPPECESYVLFPLTMKDELIGNLAVAGLQDEDQERFYILSQQFLLGIKRAVLYEGVQALCIIDGLTNVFNRRYYLERFKEELERSIKFNYVFSCVMVDIDYFKTFNDRYGHIVGDAILRDLSRTIQDNIRQVDLLSRYGGEEFSIILSEADKEAAHFAAERIRKAIEEKDIKVYDEDLKVTVSIGVSTYPTDGKDMETLIDNADSALYRAKQTGRNRVCF
ncbi:MAG: GGDEF domain-containing protein, partial [Candidatus Omnitrophica bacterium]|nr:GGDEF domain-containing protein [Candidatus Omnitrophota bacterium]